MKRLRSNHLCQAHSNQRQSHLDRAIRHSKLERRENRRFEEQTHFQWADLQMLKIKKKLF